MIALYSRVRIKKNGFLGHIVEYDDNGGKDPPVYLIELDSQFYDNDADAVDWYEDYEFEIVQ